MMSGWIESVYLASNEGGTTALTLGCSDDFYAVRLGFPNVTTTPWRLTRIIGVASEGYGDYVNPIGPGQWKPFTSAMRGIDDDRIVNRHDAPTEVIVAPSRNDSMTGLDDEPHWTWTDWTPIRSIGADRETGMRVLMLRGLIPSFQKICYSVGQFRTLLGNRQLNNGFETFVGGTKFDLDRVTEPTIATGESTAIWTDNQLAPGTIFPIVQFLTRNAGTVGMVAGDSHQQGTSTTEQFTGFLYRAMTDLGKETVGEAPVGMVNCATGGLTSDRFFARLLALLPSIRPSFVVLPGWTFNDKSGSTHADWEAVSAFAARLISTLEACRQQGVIPICLTPIARDIENMTPTQVEPWHWIRNLILQNIGRDTYVLDASVILGGDDGLDLATSYRNGLTDERVHPNDFGHKILADELRYRIEELKNSRLLSVVGMPSYQVSRPD